MHDVVFQVHPCTYQGEKWYLAEGSVIVNGLIESAYGRTPGRALGFLLQKAARHLIEADVEVLCDDLPDGVMCEAMDFCLPPNEHA